MSLLGHLQAIPDYRTQPRYPLWVILVLVIMGTMSGALGYRALGEFVVRHQAVLLEEMNLPHQRLPSFSTLRRVMERIDFRQLTQAFNAWASEAFVGPEQDQLPVDGKAIKASVKDYDQSYQDFVSVVSVFNVRQGVVVGLQPMHNRQQSEVVTVQHLLEQLQLQGVCFSLDALHTQKNS